jgi:hypothetical protein
VEDYIRYNIVEGILGKEYNGIRIRGLVDVSDDEFEHTYAEMEANWPDEFNKMDA